MAATGARKRTVKSAEERRRDIVAAALRLFRERGFDATAVGDVAAAAGVATGTVYLYFSSKEHLLEQIHADFHAGLQRAFLEVAAELVEDEGPHEVGEVIAASIDAIVGHAVRHRDACEVIHRYHPRLEAEDPYDAEFVGVLARALQAGVERGTFTVTDPAMAARLLYSAFREPVVDTVLRGDDEQLERLVTQAKELFRKFLAPEAPPGATPGAPPRGRRTQRPSGATSSARRR